MHFKTMDPELILQLIAPYTNELKAEEDRLEALYRTAVCPRCSGREFHRLLDPTHPFEKPEAGTAPSTFLPRKLLECKQCGTQLDVHSGVILAIPSGQGSTRRA